MKRWIFPLATVAVLAAVAYSMRLDRVVYDPPPAGPAMSETVVIDRPAPPVPLTRFAVPPSPATANSPTANEPAETRDRLNRQLVIRTEVPARVPQGQIILPPGMPVDLAQDRGTSVDIKFGHKKQAVVVTVPRGAIANREEEPPLEVVFNPVSTVRQTIAELSHAPASSIAIEAKEVGTGKGVARAYDDLAGSTDKSAFRTKGLTVTVRNLSRRPTGDCDINVYWTGRRLADNQLQITHGETFSVNLEGVSEHAETSWCPLLDSKVTTYDWTTRRDLSGSKFDGWFVVVTRENQMLVGRGATETYNALIRDSAQLHPLLATWTGSNLHATGSRPLWRHERPGETASPQNKTGSGARY
jgi:hypothetical protein